MREEGRLIATSRGYTDPQPLSKTGEDYISTKVSMGIFTSLPLYFYIAPENGWESLAGSSTVSILLGTISIPQNSSSSMRGAEDRNSRGDLLIIDLLFHPRLHQPCFFLLQDILTISCVLAFTGGRVETQYNSIVEIGLSNNYYPSIPSSSGNNGLAAVGVERATSGELDEDVLH